MIINKIHFYINFFFKIDSYFLIYINHLDRIFVIYIRMSDALYRQTQDHKFRVPFTKLNNHKYFLICKSKISNSNIGELYITKITKKCIYYLDFNQIKRRSTKEIFQEDYDFYNYNLFVSIDGTDNNYSPFPMTYDNNTEQIYFNIPI